MKGPPLGPGGEDITSPDQVAPRDRRAPGIRKMKPQTSHLEFQETVQGSGTLHLHSALNARDLGQIDLPHRN